jgi:hypothetical protein
MFDSRATAACSKCHGLSSMRYGPAVVLVLFLLWAGVDAALGLNKSVFLKMAGIAAALTVLFVLIGILPLQCRPDTAVNSDGEKPRRPLP